MKSRGDAGAAKLERKTVEKNRRIQMKNLCMKLGSLIPKQDNISTNKDLLSQQDYLDQATCYITSLQESIEKLRRRRNLKTGSDDSGDKSTDGGGSTAEMSLPVVEVRLQDSNLEVVLVTGLDKRFLFHEVIGLLEDEGAQVVNANFSAVGDKIFHTIHSQALSSSRFGLDASEITERLKQLIG